MNPFRKLVPALRTLLLLPLLGPMALAEGDLDAVWRAIKRDDPRALRIALPGVNLDAPRSSDGQTPLTLAAKRGSFECVRELLWAGAGADFADARGRIAKNQLTPGSDGFTGLCLLIRCHSFAQAQVGETTRAAVPHRVVINDAYVDPDHPDYRNRSWKNKAEEEGKPGVDDDSNGFIDDVSGWNVGEDLPLRIPSLALGQLRDPNWLQKLVTEYLDASQKRKGDPEEIQERLSNRYENPLARQVGIQIAEDRGLSDWYYADKVYSLSHGTHVAGIVMKSSGGNAEIHGVSYEPVEGNDRMVQKAILRQIEETMKRAALDEPDYSSFIRAVWDDYLAANVRAGNRYSQYLKACGAGVVNMSYSFKTSFFRNLASTIQDHYRKHGSNPVSMESFVCPIGMDLCGSLALELQVANSAFFALAAAQNPDILFIAAAGNDAENNDSELPAPAYLSRFFPNYLTVASVGTSDDLSSFSNHGLRSVQIAARGENVISSYLGGIHEKMSGTSMAAPEVSGVAAALRFSYPDLRAPEVRRILLASARPVSALKDKVATTAVVDRERALQLASAWDRGLALFVNESWEWPSDPDKAPVVTHPVTGEDRAGTQGGNKKSPGTGDSGASRTGISSIGGFSDQWRIVATTMPEARQQSFLLSKEWPADWLNEQWTAGSRITSLGGDPNGWAVVTTSSPSISQQRLVGYFFDQTTLKANMDEGYRIRCVAGYGEKWVFVMDKSTGYGNQRYSPPGSFDDKRKAWIQARAKEGLRITSVAGENGPDDGNSWLVVMSENSGYGTQIYTGPGPWPTDWIHSKWKEGYLITAVTGFGAEAWLVVMSKSTQPDKVSQRYSDQLSDPTQWIETIRKN